MQEKKDLFYEKDTERERERERERGRERVKSAREKKKLIPQK